ncbi:MAG: response regulator [Anaerolineae bacterium]
MTDLGTVLVVDDEAFVRKSLDTLLSAHEYNVLKASEAKEALQIMESQLIDLVITDLRMPGIDGLTLLKEIKRRSPKTPVVMLTGQGSMEVVIQALRQGVADFMTKPYDPDDLLNIVRREMQHARRWAQQEKPPMALGLYLSDEDLESIETKLATLRAELSARCILLVEGTGHAIASKGALNEIDVSALTALVAGDMAAASSIAALIGEGDTFQMNYHEGQQYSVYSAQVVSDVFLLIVFGEEVKLGAVLYYARETLETLKAILEEAQREEARRTKPASKPAQHPDELEKPRPSSTPEFVSEEASASTKVFSLEELMERGLLEEDALTSLQNQLDEMWTD